MAAMNKKNSNKGLFVGHSWPFNDVGKVAFMINHDISMPLVMGNSFM